MSKIVSISHLCLLVSSSATVETYHKSCARSSVAKQCPAPIQRFTLSQHLQSHRPLSTNKHPVPTLMSHAQPAGSSSSDFQLIFDNALKAYEKRTRNDLLTHPLAVQLQACQSPSSTLVILQQQVEELNRSRSSDERLTRWLDPTVNVLYAFSATLGDGVGLVCATT